jgi:hypothetical protein
VKAADLIMHSCEICDENRTMPSDKVQMWFKNNYFLSQKRGWGKLQSKYSINNNLSSYLNYFSTPP